MSSQKIGFFDSGVGGLSVLKIALSKLSPRDYVYFGDTARMPYGIREPNEVEQFTVEGINYISSDLKALVIACNTATAFGLKRAEEVFDFPIIGVVKPVCEYINKKTKNNKVALLATEGTVKSKVYEKTLQTINPDIELIGLGCPDLVLAIENGHIDDLIVKKIIEEKIEKIDDFDYDTLILGCTHFPLAIKTFEKVFKEKAREINIVDPAEKAIEALENILEKNSDTKKTMIDFYITGDVEKFKETALKVLDLENTEVKFNKVDLVDKKD